MNNQKKAISTTEARIILKSHLHFSGRIMYDFAAKAEKPTTLVGCYVRSAKELDSIIEDVRYLGFDNNVTINMDNLVRIHGCRKVGR